jgi:hypothetical protein
MVPRLDQGHSHGEHAQHPRGDQDQHPRGDQDQDRLGDQDPHGDMEDSITRTETVQSKSSNLHLTRSPSC